MSNRDPGEDAIVDYTGYKLLSAVDLQYDEDLEGATTGAAQQQVDSRMLRDKGKISKSMLLSIVLFSFSFISVLVWQVLIARCKVDTLCETIDESSELSSDYPFHTIRFRVPSAMVWIGLPSGCLGLLAAAVTGFQLLKKSVGPARVVEVATILQKGSSALLSQQCIALFGTVLLTLIFLGITINWNTAACFGLGALVCINACLSGAAALTRGNTRTSAAARLGLREPFFAAFRSGSVICLSIYGIASIGISGAYLIFSDIRSVSGLAAGSSVVALLIRMSSGIFNRAASDNLDMLLEGPHRELARDSKGTPNIATCVGSGVGRVGSLGSDFFSSLAVAVTATAILGSSLPFYYRDPFALCVYNHLAIDQTCGPFGYPEELSYATYICSNDNLYLKYPTLTTWASNSAFVSVPFVLLAVGALVSLITTVNVYFSKSPISVLAHVDDVIAVVDSIKKRMILNIIVGYVVVTIGAAALCFGLFGANSDFQSYDGFGNSNLAKRELDGSASQCISEFLNTDPNPFPIPQGAALIAGDYSPVTVSGLSLGEARYTPWRLFLCIMIGVVLSSLLTGFSFQVFSIGLKGPVKRLYRAAQFSPGLGIIQGLGSGLLYSAVPTVLVGISVYASYKLYGPYGTGLTAVGFLSVAGPILTAAALGQVAASANDLAWASDLPDSTKATTGILGVFGNIVSASAMEISSTASVLSACAMLFVVAEQSGILPAPSDLIGSKEVAPARFIGSMNEISLLDVFVAISALVGTMVPIVLAGALIRASSSATAAIYYESCRQKPLTEEQPNYAQFFSRVSRTALLESTIPMLISVGVPLAVGFGFGQKAVVGLAAAAVCTGYVLGSALTTTSGIWTGVTQHLASMLIVDPLAGGSRGRLSSQVTDFWETAGPSLQVLTKVTTSVSVVMVTLMQEGRSRGWIGAVILAVGIGLAGMIIVFKRYRESVIMSGVGERTGGEPRAPPKVVSPFYEDGPTIDPATVRPGSQADEALQAVGNPTVHVSPKILPGLSDREESELGNVGDLARPRSPVLTSPRVLVDEARETRDRELV